MKLLTAAQNEQYRQQGYVSPVRVMSAEKAESIRSQLEAFEKSQGGPLKGSMRHKSHLLFSWLADLVREEKILDAVEDL